MNGERCECDQPDRFDVINKDASVTHSLCMECCLDAEPIRPCSPDPVKAQWLADVTADLDQALAIELDDQGRPL